MKNRNTIIFWAGALLVFLPFLPLLLNSEQALLFRDLSNIQIPYKASWMAAVSELGRIPHWDPMHIAGYPFIADLNYGPLYPLNWLLFPLSAGGGGAARALSLLIVLHHLFIYVGSFLLLRDLRARPLLAMMGGLAAAWAGASMSSDVLLHHICGQAAVPFFFYFWRRSWRRRIFSPYLFGASAALAWPLYGGDPQYLYLLAVIGVFWAFLRRGELSQKIFRVGALGILTILASAPQLFSTAAFLVKNGRMLDSIWDIDRLTWSLHPWRLLETSIPLFFGTNPETFWATELLFGSSRQPFLFSIYAGAVIVALAILHLFLRPPLQQKSRQELRRLAWLSFFVIGILLTLGIASPIPIYEWAMKIAPLWRSFRYPERLGYWLSFAILLCGIVGAEKIFRLPKIIPRRIFMPAIIYLLGSTAALSTWILLRGHTLSMVPISLAAALAALAILWGKNQLGQEKATALLLAILVLEMAPVANKLVWAGPLALTNSSSFPWAEKILLDLRNRKAGEADRFFSLMEEPDSKTPTLVQYLGFPWAGMQFNAPTYWNIPLVRGHSSLMPKRPLDSITSISTAMVKRALNLQSTRYFLQMGETAPNPTVNLEALPLVFAPERVEALAKEAALSRLRDPTWNPAHSALVESNDAGSRLYLKVLEMKKNWDKFLILGQTVQDSAPGWVIVNEAYDSQWEATLEGKRLEIARANGWALAVRLPSRPAGSNFELQLNFTDWGYRFGLFALLAWLFLLASAFISQKRMIQRG